MVSHDMRLISQVAKEIWICDHKRITVHKGDIQSFKMDMRSQMGIEGQQKGQLRGDASTKKTANADKLKKKASVAAPAPAPAPAAKPAATKVVHQKVVEEPKAADDDDAWGDEDNDDKKSSLRDLSSLKDDLPKDAAPAPPKPKSSYVPPHLRNKAGNGEEGAAAPPRAKYVPPHLRNR